MSSQINQEVLAQIGNLCQKTRKAQKLSVKNIESQLHIKERIIIAIEEGTIDEQAIAPVYIKAFVKKYCEFLNIAQSVPLHQLMMIDESNITANPTAALPAVRATIKNHGLRAKTQIIIGLATMALVVLIYWVASGAYIATPMQITLSVPKKLNLDAANNHNPSGANSPIADGSAPNPTANPDVAVNPNKITISLENDGWLRVYDGQNQMLVDGVFAQNQPIIALDPSTNVRIYADNETITIAHHNQTLTLPIGQDGLVARPLQQLFNRQ